MADINLIAGTLPPPACYADEQERLDAYVAAIVAILSGGIQWEAGQVAPVDLTIYWLQLDANGRPVGAYKYSSTDAKWLPVFNLPITAPSSGGLANAYSITNSPLLPTTPIQTFGRRFVFSAVAANTGASTLDVDASGTKPITRNGGTALQAGDIVAGQIVDVIYNTAGGGRWEVQSPLPPIAVDFPLPTYETVTAGVPAAGGKVDMPHSGGKAPEAVRIVLVCNDTDAGFSVNDEVEYTSFIYKVADDSWPAFTGAADVTNVTLIRATISASVWIFGPTFILTAVTTTKWSVKAYLIFFP